jgi:phosphotransferase system HPr (HPr) family protein
LETTRTLRLKNPAGLHARPCHAIAKIAADFESRLTVSCGGLVVNGRSILELMTLCAPCHSELVITAVGKDADLLIAKLAEVVEAGFQELE